MDKVIIDVLSIKGENVAKHFSISKINRLPEIMKKTAIDVRGKRFHTNRKSQDPLEHG